MRNGGKILIGAAAVVAVLAIRGPAITQDAQADKAKFAAKDIVKIGLILPMSGRLAATGTQIENGVRLYMRRNGDSVAGKKIEIILKDDGGIHENARKAATDLIADEKVNVLAGFGITPSAVAVAPFATQARIPQVVMGATTSLVTERSPYIVRTSATLPQSTTSLAEWAVKNGIRRVTAFTTDYAPGNDALQSFRERFTARGGQIVDEAKAPLSNPDFVPFLMNLKDSAPDALFLFLPAEQAGGFMAQYAERGLGSIKVICNGNSVDDDVLEGMGEASLGVVSAHFYSAAHPSKANSEFVAAYRAAFGVRPNYMAVGGYDGMHLIYEALKAARGKTDGDTLIEAMKDVSWESPRGPITIDADTRDVIQNIYIRKVEKQNGELHNVEFATFDAVKDPAKAKR